MRRSPDISPRVAAPVRAAGLFALAALILALAVLYWESDRPGTAVATIAAKSSPASSVFPAASRSRLFLSERDQAEAVRRGLLPAHVRSVIATGGELAFGDWRWDDDGVPAGPIFVRVDLARQLVSVFKGPHEIGTAVIVYGIDGKETPRGRLPILGKSRDHHSRTYDAPMPFSLWLRADGVAIHGSSVRMGKATNGCIGVPVEFAGKLFEVAAKGDVVEVVSSPV